MQFWSFEDRGPKQPQTLMDAIEDAPVLVYGYYMSIMMVKKRKGDMGYTVLEQGEVTSPDSPAANYKFIRYLDPPPVVLPATLGVGEPYRLYSVAGYSGLWWKDAAGTSWNISIDGISSTTSGLPTSSRVLSATNIFAVLKTLD